MDLGLDGRTALVMGASRGLGRAIAAALADEGCRVAIASRSKERIEEAAAGIGGAATPFVADASDLERLAALPGEVEALLGPVEILVANTGGPSPRAASRPSDWRRPKDRSRRRKRRPGLRCPPVVSAGRRSTATWSPSSAPTGPPTSPGP
jgi:3-oxoacyl-[acyl-carrier protein] reductase